MFAGQRCWLGHVPLKILWTYKILEEISDVRLHSQAANILDGLNYAGFCNHDMRFKLATKWEYQDSVFHLQSLPGQGSNTQEKSAERFT
jgi:hypothetical protein